MSAPSPLPPMPAASGPSGSASADWAIGAAALFVLFAAALSTLPEPVRADALVMARWTLRGTLPPADRTGAASRPPRHLPAATKRA